MHHRNRRGRIHHRHIQLPRPVDHPVVPTRATNGERGKILQTATAWEDEEIRTRRRLQLPAALSQLAQTLRPLRVLEVPRATQVDVVTLPHHQELREGNPTGRFGKIVQQHQIGVDIAQQTRTRPPRGLGKNPVQQRRAVFIARQARHVFDAKPGRRFRHALLVSEDERPARRSQSRPGFQRVGLDSADMAAKRLGYGEQREHQAARSPARTSVPSA